MLIIVYNPNVPLDIIMYIQELVDAHIDVTNPYLSVYV